jgi:hypothetical protein
MLVTPALLFVPILAILAPHNLRCIHGGQLLRILHHSLDAIDEMRVGVFFVTTVRPNGKLLQFVSVNQPHRYRLLKISLHSSMSQSTHSAAAAMVSGDAAFRASPAPTSSERIMTT